MNKLLVRLGLFAVIGVSGATVGVSDATAAQRPATAPSGTKPFATSTSAAGELPSCRAYFVRGPVGTVNVRTSPNGTIAWGIYMNDPAANGGPWEVNVHVDKTRVDHKLQIYPPHGSVPPKEAKHGAVFSITAVHHDPTGQQSFSVPNACLIP